jgi:hypothetical protein
MRALSLSVVVFRLITGIYLDCARHQETVDGQPCKSNAWRVWYASDWNGQRDVCVPMCFLRDVLLLV